MSSCVDATFDAIIEACSRFEAVRMRGLDMKIVARGHGRDHPLILSHRLGELSRRSM
jgi:hypothetical protein